MTRLLVDAVEWARRVAASLETIARAAHKLTTEGPPSRYVCGRCYSKARCATCDEHAGTHAEGTCYACHRSLEDR